MKIAFGCDHGGIIAKNDVIKYLKNNGYEVLDFGTNDENSCDYPDFALSVSNAVASGEASFGILICGTGIGMSICANKVNGIRCGHVTDVNSAKLTREHNNANVIALGARINTNDEIVSFVKAFLTTDFQGGRHERRVEKMMQIEKL